MSVLSEEQNAGEKRTIISVDAMGGDRGPATVVAGISRSAKKNPDIGFILHGPKDELEKLERRRGHISQILDRLEQWIAHQAGQAGVTANNIQRF